MKPKRKATKKIMENITNEEMNQLIEGLKKIDEFEFSVSSFVVISNNQADL